MELKAKINGKEYDIVQGNTFAEEYNETLDSGSLIISQIPQIENMYPYDDVFIYTGSFNGYPFNESNPKPTFYKHLLIDQFTEEVINLDKGIYKYKFELMSETKGLEVVFAPNRSVTQPLLFDKKVSVWEYANRYVNLYSPRIKMAKNAWEWEFVQKYTLSPDLEDMFKDVYAPDFTLNDPSLKDILSKLFIIRDKIPYVQDDVIYAMDISERKGEFFNDPKHVNLITGSMSSDNYCDNLRREYTQGLGQDGNGRLIEYMGFRNSNESLMTLGNMRLEFSNEIYKINKIYMCYYKEVTLKKTGSSDKTVKFLCKQDITPLVKLETERSLLSQDWHDFTNTPPATMTELAKYKIATLGYSVGSKTITGWGTIYTIPAGSWLGADTQHTYIENVLKFVEFATPYGIYGLKGLLAMLPQEYNDYGIEAESIFPINISTSDSSFFKTLFFICDYTPFYSGTVVVSRPDGRDNITINDNESASLTLLKQDGLFQEEKIKRFGNKGLQINARYDDISQLQELGSVYNDKNAQDMVIYHREYSIYDKCIDCTYYATKNYVLKNYYTSVYAKYRTWSMMDYSESVKRADNERVIYLMSKDKLLGEKELPIQFSSKDNIYSQYQLLSSAFTPSDLPTSIDYFNSNKVVNFGCFELPQVVYNEDGTLKEIVRNYFKSDVATFMDGKSLCMNLKMKENVSSGTYIRELEPIIKFITLDVEKDVVGSTQTNYMNTDDIATGEIKDIGVYVGHFDYENYYLDKITEVQNNNQDIKDIYDNALFKLPKLEQNINISDCSVLFYNKKTRYKDNKEFEDMTFQFEPLSKDKDIAYSDLFFGLSDLSNSYQKFAEDYYLNYYSGSNYIIIDKPTYEEHSLSVGIRNDYFVFTLKLTQVMYEAIVTHFNNTSQTPLKISSQQNVLIECKTGTIISTTVGTSFSLDFITGVRNNDSIIDISYIRSGGDIGFLNFAYKGLQDGFLAFEAKIPSGYILKKIKKAIGTIGLVNNISDVPASLLRLYPRNMYLMWSTKEVDNNTLPKEFRYNGILNWTNTLDKITNFINLGEDINGYTYNGSGFNQGIYLTSSEQYSLIDNSKIITTGYIPTQQGARYEFTDFNFETQLAIPYCISIYDTNKNLLYAVSSNDIVVGNNLIVLDGENNKGIQKDSTLYRYIVRTPKAKYIRFSTAITTNPAINLIEYDYLVDDKIYYNGQYYKAKTAVTNNDGQFDSNQWETTDNKLNETDTILPNAVDEVFQVTEDELNRPCILVLLENIPLEAKSVQYWFLSNGSLKFVFGVNIKAEDREIGFVKIYTSLISTKDERVYDDKHNVVGNSMNYAINDIPLDQNVIELYSTDKKRDILDLVMSSLQDLYEYSNGYGLGFLSHPKICPANLEIPAQYNNKNIIYIEPFYFENSNNSHYVSQYLQTVKMPSTMLEIRGSAFYNCNALTYVDLGENLTKIEGLAFALCDRLETVVMYNKVITIDTMAFEQDYVLTVYYKGTETEWNAMQGSGKTFLNDRVKFYSETVRDGYWHFVDGKPVMW